ncbi:dGTPase [Photobacterium phosphoreum]|uniref:dGTPase n=1 Tax=Photobacterium phosphoreum TaxID=659 RepID=UPI001E5DBAA5|nr:dGTPase [Photobacterium phosphoreum]MCD9504872.1 dGTPase [Photobacterium phosphoreum]
MNYKEKLKPVRFRQSTIVGRCFNEEMESDRGRAINSAAVRRLQQKTQVFPLETNAAVRSRLTHSLEVQQVGRYIAKTMFKKLSEQDLLEKYNLLDYKDGFVSAIEISCLLHDIGNPPFGHFGEEAINLWGKDTLSVVFNEKFGKESRCKDIICDLVNFEGNAQGIRILHSLQSLNLTYTQLACLLKYTRSAYEDKPCDDDAFKYRKKKPGYYLSEEDLFNDIMSQLSVSPGCRFPLTYIMEAADDISYCIADLDDAVDKGILTIDQLHSEIKKIWKSFKEKEEISNAVVDDGYLLKIADEAYEKYMSEPHNKKHAYILTLRTKFVNDLSNYAAQRFIDNHEKIFHGELDESLLDGDDKYHLATETLRYVAVNNVFNHREVENLELKGYAVISGLLKLYTPLIQLDYSDFKVLVEEDRLKKFPIATRLFHKLSSKHRGTYCQAVEYIYSTKTPSNEEKMMELYHRSRLIIDYISGMTDQFALEEFQNLTAVVS